MAADAELGVVVISQLAKRRPLPLADLDRLNGVVDNDLLDRLAATDRLHGDLGLELGTVGSALAELLRKRLRLRWVPRSEAVPRLRGKRWGRSRKTRQPQFESIGVERDIKMTKAPPWGGAE